MTHTHPHNAIGPLGNINEIKKNSPSDSPHPSPRAPAAAVHPLGTLKASAGGVVDVELPSADQIHQALIRIVSTLLREQPAVMILEDAHDMDEKSWKVVIMVVMSLTNDILILSSMSCPHLVDHFGLVRSDCSHLARDDSSNYGSSLKTATGLHS